jgi:hypothetical protein
MFFGLYILVLIILNVSGYDDVLIKEINKQLDTNMDGVFMTEFFLIPTLILQGISEIISKLDKLNK